MSVLFFYKVLSAIVFNLIIIYFSIFYPSEVGVIFSLISLGNLLSSSFFGTYVFKTDKKYEISLLGLLSFLFPLFSVVYYNQKIILYLSSFLFAFLNPVTYFALLAIITEKGIDEKEIKRFEFLNGIYWTVGLLLGFLLISFLKISSLIYYMFFVSLLVLLIFTFSYLKFFVLHLLEAFAKDIGLLVLLEKSLEKFEKFNERIIEIVYSKMFSTPFSLISFVQIKKPKTETTKTKKYDS